VFSGLTQNELQANHRILVWELDIEIELLKANAFPSDLKCSHGPKMGLTMMRRNLKMSYVCRRIYIICEYISVRTRHSYSSYFDKLISHTIQPGGRLVGRLVGPSHQQHLTFYILRFSHLLQRASSAKKASTSKNKSKSSDGSKNNYNADVAAGVGFFYTI